MSDHYSLHQFNRFCSDEKFLILDQHGAYLETYRIEGCYKVALFALFTYYVELWHDPAKDEFVKASAFISNKKLDVFLAEINIAPAFA